MSKLLGILTKDQKDVSAEKAAIDVEQQAVNLDAYAVATKRNLSALKAQSVQILRGCATNMWQKYDENQGQIAELEEVLRRLDAYKAEFFG